MERSVRYAMSLINSRNAVKLGAKSLLLVVAFLCSSLWNYCRAEEPGCITEKCHSGFKSFKFPHAVLTTCDSCHSLTDKKKHKFKLNAAGKELCAMCHEDVEKGKEFKHSPVSEGSCTSCHNPHGADNKELLIESDISKLCVTCHGDQYVSGAYKHGPIQSGDCTSCHKPHGSAKPKLLDLAGTNLCAVCHPDKVDLYSKAKVVHQPVKMNCIVCHDPHSSTYPKYIKSTFTRVCLTCHTRGTLVSGSWVSEFGKSSGFRCSDCHNPHYSTIKKLLKKEVVGTCPVLN
jgi:predicted CXXCH cytochrome family protein